MTNNKQNVEQLVDAICALPSDFHEAGVMTADVLRMMARLLSSTDIRYSAETGSGKTTLLFSHFSAHHTVFARDRFGDFDARSMSSVQSSELFKPETTHFVIGSTQETLPQHRFEHLLDVVLIDGPHGYPFPELEYYYFYPQLREGGLLLLDDIHIPTLWRMFEFIREDAMFELVEVCGWTAVFRRTAAECFNPLGDGWWKQGFNEARWETARELTAARLRQLQGADDDSLPHIRPAFASRLNRVIYRFLSAIFGQRFADRLRFAIKAFKAAG
ncbi:MAG: hypothetical protein Tsb002_06880 [Wenzhouxiangellaceae bacterium]